MTLRHAFMLGATTLLAAGLLEASDPPVLGGEVIGSTTQAAPPDAHDGKDNDPCDQCGNSDPIELATGEFKLDRTDLVLPGLTEPLEITFRYRSQRMVNGPLGFGWLPAFEQRLFELSDGRIVWRVGSGEKILLAPIGQGVYEPEEEKYHVGLTVVAGGWRIDELLTGNVYLFDDKGLLLQIVDRRGNATTLTWDTDGGAVPVKFPVAGADYITAFDYRIKTIESTLGKKVTFTYYAPPSTNAGRLERIEDDYGRSVLYEYTDGRDNLTAVQSPATDYLVADGMGGYMTASNAPRTTTYTYTFGNADPRTNAPASPLDHNLETITDDRGLVQLFNEYDANDRVVAQSAHGGTSTYVYQATSFGDVTTVDEYDGNGFHHQHKFDANRNPIELRTVSAGIHPGFGAQVLTKYGYNGDGEASTITFPLGNGIEREYTDGKLTRLTRRQVMTPPSSAAITWTYTYSPGATYKPLETVTDPLLNVTTYRYDFEEEAAGDLNGDGNVTPAAQAMGNVFRIEFPDLTRPDGTTLTPVWRRFQYNAQGQLTRTIDEEGRITDYTYYASNDPSYGLLQSITVDPVSANPGGENLTTTFTYDGFGFVDLVTDPRLKVTDYDYNAVGELVRVAGEEGVEQRFGYDANGNLVRTETRNLDETGAPQSPEWIVRTCQYDAWNRMTSCTEDVTEEVTGTTTRTTSYQYDFLGNLSQITTPEGRVQTFEYDERGILWRQVRGVGTPLASTRVWHVDRNGNVIQSIDGRGGVTTIERDLFDRAEAIVDPAGNRVEMVLSDRDEVLSRSLFDPFGGSTLMAQTLQEFDELGRLVKSKADPVSGALPPSETWYLRDKTGLLVGWRSPREEITTFDYDDAGRLESVLDPLGNQIQYTLDDNGNPEVVTSVEQVSGGTETYALETDFDGQNRPTVRRRVPLGTGTPLVTTFAWDSRSQLLTVTDPISRVMRTVYDLAGRPTSTIEDEGGLAIATGYEYDKDDLLRTLTDPDGKVTGWFHDDLGRVREIDYAEGGSELFTHDGEDAVKTHTRQDGVTTTLTYRADGALSSRTVGALREEFDWAAVGVPREARVLVSGLVRSRVSRTFDGLGRVESESQDDYTVTLGYDPSHNPTSIQWPDGYTLGQQFDELERLERIHEGPTDVATWAWSGPGRVASRSTGQNLVTTYQWDPFQRLAGLDTGAVHDVAYGYDNLDRRCWKQSQHLSGQPIDVYGYDGGSRLVDVWKDANAALCAQAPTGWSSHFELTLTPGEDRDQTAIDLGGGPVTTDYNPAGIDALHRYIKVGTNGPTRLYDDKGNLTGDGTLSYEYDAWNRLTAVKELPPSGMERARYEHDALGRRTRKIEPDLVTEYVYSGARLIAEYEDTGAGPVLARRYLHGVGLDELVALDSGAQRYFAFGDALGSVEALATGGGSVAEWYRYDAFGSATVMDGNEVEFPLNSYGQPQSPLGNALWFTGARFDGESGHYHMRARQYEPATGRFTGRDPLGYVDSANAYLYGFNNPASWLDPFGLEAQSGPKRGGMIQPTAKALAAQARALRQAAYNAGIDRIAQEHAESANRWFTMPGKASAIARGLFWAGHDVARGVGEGIGNGIAEAVLLTADVAGYGSGGDMRLSSTMQYFHLQSDLGYSGISLVSKVISDGFDSSFGAVGRDVGDGLGEIIYGEDLEGGVRQFGRGAINTAVAAATAVGTYRALGGGTPRSGRLCSLDDQPAGHGAGFGSKAPDQVTPGIRTLEGQYIDDVGQIQPWRAFYDEYGRQVERTDFTGLPDPQTHTDPHYHMREYGPGYGPKGLETYHEGPGPNTGG